jgi:mannose-6-phosphate isomerase-like protein (cupin superfamily)
LSGKAEVTLDGKTLLKVADDAVLIPARAKHRIANRGDTIVMFIEVQTGPILSEQDIERFDDRYGR